MNRNSARRILSALLGALLMASGVVAAPVATAHLMAGRAASTATECKPVKARPTIKWDMTNASGMKIVYGWSAKNCRGRIAKIAMTIYAMAPDGQQAGSAKFDYTFGSDQGSQRVRVSRYSFLSVDTAWDLVNFRGDSASDYTLVSCSSDRRGSKVNLAGYQWYVLLRILDTSGNEITSVKTDRVACGKNYIPASTA